MKKPSSLWVIWAALCGLAIHGFGIAWAICLYNRHHADGFSLLNHFVSELGSPHRSEMARVFNGSLILSSPLLFPILLTLCVHLKTRLSRAAALTGFCATLGVVGVGFFPMDFLKPHLVAAMLFFWGWLFTLSLFTVALWRKFPFRETLLLRFAGIAALAANLSFLAILMRFVHAILQLNHAPTSLDSLRRPFVWDVAISEWSVLLTAMLWNLAACAYLRRINTQNLRESAKFAATLPLP